jgi:hypothetical protein
VEVRSAMMAGLASASTTRRPSGAAYVTITELGGSCCSSCASTRNSRERCAVLAAEELVLAALEVLIPHAAAELTPAVTDRESDVPCDWLESRLCDCVKWPNGAKASWRVCPCPREAPWVSLTEAVSATESAVPTVLL